MSVTSSGSYTCNGITYDVSITSTSTLTADNCDTAEAEATATSLMASSNAVKTTIYQGTNNCNPPA